MLKTNVPISGSCITTLPIAPMKLIYQLGISLALRFPSWGKFIWNNLQDDHKDGCLGSDYVQIRFAHRAPLGLPLLHDSIITPTLKYQTAAVGSRRKRITHRRIHEQNERVQLLWNKLFFHDTSAKLAHHCVKRKIFNQQGIPSVSVNLFTLFCSKGGFLLTRLNYESRDQAWSKHVAQLV